MQADLRNEVTDVAVRSDEPRAICVLATLPPPVTGMTLATKFVVQALQESGDVWIHDWSVGSNPRRFGWRLIKAARSLWSVIYLVIWRRRSSGLLYTVANAGYGLYYNIAVIAFARLLGYRVVLHHQVFSYLHHFDRRMHYLVRMMGRDGIQIVLAPEMQQRFTELYGQDTGFYILPNTIVMQSQQRDSCSIRKWSPEQPLVLGHLSNLTIEKGLAHVIAAFERLRLEALNVRLILAGPVSGVKEKSLIDQALQTHGDAMEYRGAIYGADKDRFFNDIDVFLFPTEYKNEAQPLVVAEAINYFRPVISYGLACLPSLVGDRGGIVVPCDANFAERAAREIKSWLGNPQDFFRIVAAVEEYSDVLRTEAEESLNVLVKMLRSQCRE